MTIRELWHLDATSTEIQKKNYPEINADMQVVQAMYSLVSTGTERKVAMGLVPESVTETMKVPFMEGSFKFPVKYGYSLVGRVIKGNKELVGKTVHLMHPHQDFLVVPSECLTIVPDNVSPRLAVLASNLETAVNAIWDSRISVGDKVLICGFGIIGALIAILARQIPASEVIVHETNPERGRLAQSMGFRLFQGTTNISGEFDLALNTAASEEALQMCIDVTLPKSKIIEVSWYGTDAVNIRLGEAFHLGQKQIISSQVSNIPEHKQSHYTYSRRKQVVMELLAKDMFTRFPFHEVEFGELPGIFDQLRNGTFNHLVTLVKY